MNHSIHEKVGYVLEFPDEERFYFLHDALSNRSGRLSNFIHPTFSEKSKQKGTARISCRALVLKPFQVSAYGM
ncbi:MAG: hypothetical protein HON04_08335 [Planctomicrobium sp.]|jgi:hypothetical protein|nr:hypothetical protein [Planctomicrobium sp.]